MAIPATVIDTSQQVVAIPGGWVEIDRPIVIENAVGKIIRSDGTTNLRYVGPPTPRVIVLKNCTRCRIEGIYEIHCGQASAGIGIIGSDDSPISSVDNIIDGVMIGGGDYGIVIGDGSRKSISENTVKHCQLNGRMAGLRIHSGNGQNTYLDRVRIMGCPVAVDLVNGGVQDRGGLFAYNGIDFRIGRLNNVGLFEGTYSEGSGHFLSTASSHGTNPGSLTLNGCHVQGVKPHEDHPLLGPCVIRWGYPGPVVINGGEYDGSILAGGQAITPVTALGATFLSAEPFKRINDTGTFLALGCQHREQNEQGPRYSPLTVAQIAGESGVSINVLSWGSSPGRGIGVGTHYGQSWGSGTKWDGGGRLGGGQPGQEWKPKEKESK